MNTTKWSALQHKATRAELAAERKEARNEIERLGLGAIRKARRQTQVELAKVLHIPQPAVSEVENRADMMLSTLSRYIRAMGGRLEMKAVFKDATFDLITPPISAATLQQKNDPVSLRKRAPQKSKEPVRVSSRSVRTAMR